MLQQLALFIIFCALFDPTTSITQVNCGSFTPLNWFNLNQNDQITIEFGVIPLNTDFIIPYLFGCRPLTATSPTESISFQYNQIGLMTSTKSGSSYQSNVQYTTLNAEYWLESVNYITSDNTVTLNTFTDSDQRIVTIETSAFNMNPGSNQEKRNLMKELQEGLIWRRSIQAPLGDMNYYYDNEGISQYLASTLNVAWNGIEQVTYGYNYLFDGNNNRIGMNLTTSLFQDAPFYINFDYHYSNGRMDYYCINSCNTAKISFGYDSMGRLVNSSNSQQTLLSIQYDNKGNAVSVQTGGVSWTLNY